MVIMYSPGKTFYKSFCEGNFDKYSNTHEGRVKAFNETKEVMAELIKQEELELEEICLILGYIEASLYMATVNAGYYLTVLGNLWFSDEHNSELKKAHSLVKDSLKILESILTDREKRKIAEETE